MRSVVVLRNAGSFKQGREVHDNYVSVIAESNFYGWGILLLKSCVMQEWRSSAGRGCVRCLLECLVGNSIISLLLL